MRYVAVLVTIMLIGVAVYQVVDCRKEDDNGLLARKQPMSMKGGIPGISGAGDRGTFGVR